ncbi:MAG TPA: hypothetical protein VFO77_05820 [Actinoplanes sp.]|nr:hypothetical protein [Actinoplanes sp.]
MRISWTKAAVATGLAAAALLGAGVALGPHDDPGARSLPVTPESAAVSPTRALQAYVARTTEHLRRVPGDWQAWAQLGLTRLELARITSDPAHHRAAETALRRSLAVKPRGNAAALTGLGALAAARHQFATALAYARRAVAIDNYSADAFGVLTDACVELGRYPEATDAAQRMLDLRPDTGSYARASYVLELHGDRGRAAELMRQALAVAAGPGETTFALTHLGELAFNAGDLATASRHFEEGLARAPGQPALLAGRASVWAARGDLPAAISALREVTAIMPTVDHLTALSDALRAAGDLTGAARTDELVRAGARVTAGTSPSASADAAAGSSATADIDLVLFYADRGEAGTAVARARELYAARPSIAVETAYAWALHSAGRDAEALAHADRGLRLGTSDARAHYYRGMIRLAVGDRAGARADLTKAIGINPHFSLRHASQAHATLADLEGAA